MCSNDDLDIKGGHHEDGDARDYDDDSSNDEVCITI